MKEKLQMRQWWLAIFVIPVLFAGLLLTGLGCEEPMVEEPVVPEEEPVVPDEPMEEDDMEFDIE